MAEIVNLNRAKKAREKAARQVAAAANRARHGRSKAEKAADLAAEQARRRLLDGAKRDDRGE